MIYTMLLRYTYTNIPFIYRTSTVYLPYIYRSWSRKDKTKKKRITALFFCYEVWVMNYELGTLVSHKNKEHLLKTKIIEN